MFNTNQFNNSIQINAVSGTLVKNYKESFVLRFHNKSPMADYLFDQEPFLKTYNNARIPVVVLQVMLAGDNYMIAEVMYKSDFDAMFEKPTETEVVE